MLKKPLVSVIVPAYNEETHIRKCVMSLLKQSYEDLELIFIDDGSRDKTIDVLLQFIDKIRLIRSSHKGMAVSRNIGFNESRGKILLFLDADMYFDKDFIKELIKPILNNNCVGTYSIREEVINMSNTIAKCWNINVGFFTNVKVNQQEERGTTFRAILKEEFMKKKYFQKSWGYFSDLSISDSTFFSYPVKNAICYHYNPETLSEVYYSARWIGRAPRFPTTFRNILRYSIINSIRVSIWRIRQGAPLQFIIFKIVFDLGMLSGILYKNKKQNYAK